MNALGATTLISQLVNGFELAHIWSTNFAFDGLDGQVLLKAVEDHPDEGDPYFQLGV